MQYFGLFYTVVFIPFSVWTIVDGIRDRDPVIEVITEALALAVFVTGSCLWLLDDDTLVPVGLWLPILVLAVCAEIVVVVRGRARYLRRTPETSRSLILFADIFTPATLAPGIVMNMLYVLRSAG